MISTQQWVWLYLLATVAVGTCDICPNSNVSCPVDATCVPSTYGLRWGCNVSSITSPGKYTTCISGAPHPLSTDRKNVLIIGDSVSNGYFLEGTPGHNVPDLVADIAQVQHAPWSPGSGGAGPTSHGVDCLKRVWLNLCTGKPAKWDLITFNFGLHNLNNDTSARALYQEQLENITDTLIQTGAKLQYHLTTPMMPQCCEGGPLKPAGEGSPTCNIHHNPPPPLYKCNDVVLDLNKRATDIMTARSIPIVNLYSTVTDVCGVTYVNCSICRKEPCSYHYQPQGYDIISKPIAAMIRKLLS